MTTTAGPLSPAYRWITVGLVGQVTLIAFETIAVATAMPTTVRALDGLRLYAWAFTGFMIASVVAMVLSGLWCDRYGARRSLLAGLVAFVLGLVVSGTAITMPIFIVGRVAQGFGGGLVTVALYVVIGQLYPERMRPRIFAFISAAWVLPSLIGPFVAGALAEHGSWRWVFLGLLPVLAALSFAIWQVISRVEVPEEPTIVGYGRLAYAASAAVGLALVQLGLESIGVDAGLWTVIAIVLGVLLLVLGLRVLWPSGTVRFAAGIPATVLSRGLLTGAFFGMESLLPLTMSTVHGLSATMAGLPLLVGAVAWSAGSAFQGRSRSSRRALVAIGGGLVAVCAALLPLVVLLDFGQWLAYPIWLLGGAGMGLALSSLGVLLLDLSPIEDRGRNSSSLQVSEAVINSASIGIGGALVAASLGGALSFSSAIVGHDILAALLAAAVVLGSRRLVAPVPARL